jgi:hypothetical protein
VVIRKENEEHILDANNNGHGPKHKGHYPKDVSLSQGDGMMPVKTLPDCVEWAGPYVAVNHTKGPEGKHKGVVLELALIGFCFTGRNGAAIARVGRSVQVTPARSLKV